MKKHAWKLDQFFNPHETSHTLSELICWFEDKNISFVNSIPFTFNSNDKIFEEKIALLN